MASLNKVMIIGNLGSDPEVRYTASGSAVCNFRCAVNEKWKNREGEMQERTEWVRVVVWGKTAEHCGEYLKKGRSVYVEGRMQTREWEDKEGAKRWTTEVNADRVTFLGGRNNGESGGSGRSADGSGAPPLDDSDIPF